MALGFNLAWGSNFNGGTSDVWSATIANYSTTNAVNWMDTVGNTFFIAEVQLEVGEKATDFEHRSFADDLASCQRYYYLHASGLNQFMGSGDMYVSTQLDCNIHFPTPMRASPSLVATSGTSYYLAYGGATSTTMTNAWNLFVPQPHCATLYGTPTSSVTAGTAMRVLSYNASASVAFDAEL